VSEKDAAGGEEKDLVGPGKEGKEKIAAIGVSKKRKAGKIIGGDDDRGGTKEEVESKEKKASKPDCKTSEKRKTAKKGKKIKLSFGDDE